MTRTAAPVDAKTVLLTIGRLPKALDFARAFHLAGWRVIVAEPFRPTLTGASRAVAKSLKTPAPREGKVAYLEALARIVAAEGVDLVLPLSEETMHLAHLPPLLSPTVQVFAPPPQVVLELHDKNRFALLARSMGLTVPETYSLTDPAANDLARAGDYVVKPVFSCSGRGVTLHARGAPLPAIAERAVVQARIVGRHRSTFSILNRGRVQITVVYAGTVINGTVAVAFERVEEPAIAAWVAQFAATTAFSGFASFDFIVDAAGVPWAIECNPRVTSGVHFIETEDLAAAVLTPFDRPIRLRANRQMQQFFPTLTETQASILRPKRFIANLKRLLVARDVSWARDDPAPLATMPYTAFAIIARSIRDRQSFGVAATADISWFEDP